MLNRHRGSKQRRAMTLLGRSSSALLVLLALSPNHGLFAQTTQLTIVPANPGAGALIRLTLQTEPSADSIAAVRGTIAGEPLRFLRARPHTWHAIGAIPINGTDTIFAIAAIEHASGLVDTVRLSVKLPAPPPRLARKRRLAVSGEFTRPPDSATQARIDREMARARAVGKRSHESPPLWTTSFLRPRRSSITSRFGSGRLFNGTLKSNHAGVDFAGKTGAEIHSANRGVVALVDTFFLAGIVTYIDHGAGVVTGYFHMSEPLVAVGDTVERGQLIGRVGATGRVTGPHLHWSARYGTITMNPMDLTKLDRDWYSGRLKER
jgi:murein DD-endopeptidase MepM/ murein hydrolase activator NlpD